MYRVGAQRCMSGALGTLTTVVVTMSDQDRPSARDHRSARFNCDMNIHQLHLEPAGRYLQSQTCNADSVRLSPPPPLDVSSELGAGPRGPPQPRGSHSHAFHSRVYSGISQRPVQQAPNRPLSPTDAVRNSSGGAASVTTSIGAEPSYPPPPYTPAVQQQISRHQRMLLFLRHCAKCSDPVGCRYGWRCESGKELWQHIFSCCNPRCTFQNCVQARELLRHYQKCHDPGCPICGPVREFLASPQGQAGGLPQNMM